MSEKMWGGEPFWGLGYEWDPDWVYTDRQKELRATLIELCEKEMRANAKANPNSWLYVIDPNFTGTEAGAAEIVGAFPVNAAGEIEDDFQPNPEYKPLPGGPLDRTLELISTGAGDRDELLAAILDARLLVYAESTGDRSVTGFPSADGRVMVPACTSADRAGCRAAGAATSTAKPRSLWCGDGWRGRPRRRSRGR